MSFITKFAISIKFEHIDKICEVLDCTADELFEYCPNKIKTTGKNLIVEQHGNRKKN